MLNSQGIPRLTYARAGSGYPGHRPISSVPRAQLAAIRAGCGIGVCQVGLAQRDARLVRVLPADFSIGLETWVAMHEDLRATRRCRLTYDALAAGLSDYIASAE